MKKIANRIPHVYILHFIFYILLLTSCTSKYPGFSETETGLYYQLHYWGEGAKKPHLGEYVKINAKLKTFGDTLLKEDKELYAKIKNNKDGDMQEGLCMLVEGDSATFIVKRPHPAIEDSMMDVLLDVKMLQILTPEQYRKKQEYEQWKAEKLLKEHRKLFKFLEENEIGEKRNVEGIYFIPIKRGKGERIKSGDVIWVHYEGFFLDSTKFDSTYDRGEPFDFNFGDPNQVIRGLEIAISLMRNKGKAKIIIPSPLAFGEQGSSTGIVPPFTTLIYKLEIVKKLIISKKENNLENEND
ncbi:MAG: hypothetical protein COA57_07210 [Flavobacteriales bacterium]|nr:MAG: hypothetical protein COA57_07210 [Flavobacteriales bacterium]